MKTGNMLHRYRLSNENIYIDVLKKYYPEGIHVYDDDEISILKRHIKNEFDINVTSSNRGIASAISKCGLLCDRGTYKAKEDKLLSDELISKIEKYIDNSEMKIFLTNTIFSIFETELADEGVTNKYHLHGILREIFGEKWMFRRDYISKDKDITSFYDSVVAYIKSCPHPVFKEDIYNAFPGITDIVIQFATGDNAIVNLFGSYLHESRFRLSKGDILFLKSIIDSTVKDSGYCHCKDVYRIANIQNHSLLINNFINYFPPSLRNPYNP